MPQVSLYFDETLAQMVSSKAKKDAVSVSKYVSTILDQHFRDE